MGGYIGGVKDSGIKIVSVTVLANALTGTVAHNMGKIPNIIGRPNPNQSDGLDSYSSVDATTLTITCNSWVTTNTIFTQALS